MYATSSRRVSIPRGGFPDTTERNVLAPSVKPDVRDYAGQVMPRRCAPPAKARNGTSLGSVQRRIGW